MSHYAVGQVSALAGVTVRTLHHYDEIGLLSPDTRNHAGHRLYGEAGLDRLQRILFYRELGFPLEEVAARPVGIPPHRSAFPPLVPALAPRPWAEPPVGRRR